MKQGPRLAKQIGLLLICRHALRHVNPPKQATPRRGCNTATVLRTVANSAHVAAQTVMPNPSLNRTLHSLPAFGLKQLSPNTANLFRAG